MPYVGVDDFTFGLSWDEIKFKLGEAPKIIIDNILGVVIEHRSACEFVYRDKKLVSVTFNKHTNPMVDNIEIYVDGALDLLKTKYCNYIEGNKYILFRDIGICIGGFSKKKIPEGKLVIAFSKEELPLYELFAES